ncbi:MAG: hypothetical protein JXR44_02450 [Thiotrichales bacterium]|nr:hypothetical protein [Thiotrichales bacterium]
MFAYLVVILAHLQAKSRAYFLKNHAEDNQDLLCISLYNVHEKIVYCSEEDMQLALKKSLRNSALLAIAIAAIALYQGETPQTATLTLVFSFLIMLPAFWLSYWLTNRHQTDSKAP